MTAHLKCPLIFFSLECRLCVSSCDAIFSFVCHHCLMKKKQLIFVFFSSTLSHHQPHQHCHHYSFFFSSSSSVCVSVFVCACVSFDVAVYLSFVPFPHSLHCCCYSQSPLHTVPCSHCVPICTHREENMPKISPFYI